MTARQGDRLTDREVEVLAELAEGHGSKEAAVRLGISNQTVKNHLTTIYRKLGVSGLVAALRAIGWLKVGRR